MRARAIAFAAAIFFVAPVVSAQSGRGASISADDKKAAKYFTDGSKAFEAGDYRRAAQLFEQAYQTKPHHSALWNAAKSWQRAGEDLTAVNLLLRYLKEAPTDAPNRAEANAALAEIEKRVGRIQLQIVYVTSATLDGNEAKEGLSYVAPGEHALAAVNPDDPNTPVQKVVTVKPGEILSVTLSPPAKVEVTKPKVIVIEKKSGVSPWFVVGGGVLTAGGAAATVVLGLMTVNARNAFLKNETKDNLDAGNAAQTRTNIALGATIGLAVITTAVAIFFTDWHGSEPPKTTAQVTF